MGEAHEAFLLADEDRKQYFIENIIVQMEIATGLYSWLYNLCLAASERLSGNMDGFREFTKKAVFALRKLLMDRTKAGQGKWANWYRGDKKLNIPYVLERTEANLHR